MGTIIAMANQQCTLQQKQDDINKETKESELVVSAIKVMQK